METRSSKKRKMESEEEKNTFSTNLFDLPMEMLIYLGKFLELKDILNFRCYSRYSREVGNAMLSDLRKLYITDSFPRNKRQLLMLVNQCHSLREIDILLSVTKTITTDKIIENLWSNNPLLEDVVFGITDNTGITSKALVPLATKCKNLAKLDIRRLNPGNEFLEALSAHNNHLVKVDFDFYVNSLDQMEKFWEFIKNQPKLQLIGFPDMLLGSRRTEEMYEKILLTIAEVCKELTCLENLMIEFCGLRGLLPLRKIVENCPKLERVEFAYDERVSGKILSYLKSKSIYYYVYDGGCSESERNYGYDDFSDDSSPQDSDSDLD